MLAKLDGTDAGAEERLREPASVSTQVQTIIQQATDQGLPYSFAGAGALRNLNERHGFCFMFMFSVMVFVNPF